MAYYLYESQTPDEARRRIAARNREAALAWLDQVGSWPSDDPEIREVTRMANRLLGLPNPAPEVTLGQALVALGLTGIATATIVAGVRMGRGQYA